jgi:hypothetical protein
MNSKKLKLTHLWIDQGLLFAKDVSGSLFTICPEEVFFMGPQDSLKKCWTQNSAGIRYRKIRGTKQCYHNNSAEGLVALTEVLGLTEAVRESFNKTYFNTQ